MAEIICPGADTEIKWDHWHQLATKIDDLAVSLGAVAYDPLTSDENKPFIVSALPQVTACMQFEVVPTQGSCPVISDRYLTAGFGGAKIGPGSFFNGVPYHDFYEAYVQAGKLFFVHEDDDCWCKTIFRITSQDTSGWSLEEYAVIGKRGCCQTIEVPTIGDILDYTQKFIPAAYTCTYGHFDYEHPDNAANPVYCPKCTPPNADGCDNMPGADKVEYLFGNVGTPPDQKKVMVSTARPVQGYLTWPILKEHMDAFYEAIDNLLECQNNGGLKAKNSSGYASAGAPTLWWKNPTYSAGTGGKNVVNGWHFKGAGCSAYVHEAWLDSLEHENVIDDTEAGTIAEKSGAYQICHTTYKKPWEVKTGDAEDCDEAGIKVYCETLNQISELVEEIEDRLWSRGAFNPTPVNAPSTECDNNNVRQNIQNALDSCCVTEESQYPSPKYLCTATTYDYFTQCEYITRCEIVDNCDTCSTENDIVGSPPTSRNCTRECLDRECSAWSNEEPYDCIEWNGPCVSWTPWEMPNNDSTDSLTHDCYQSGYTDPYVGDIWAYNATCQCPESGFPDDATEVLMECNGCTKGSCTEGGSTPYDPPDPPPGPNADVPLGSDCSPCSPGLIPCCLLNKPAVVGGTLQNINEIRYWVETATGGYISSCRHKEGSFSTVQCGEFCAEDEITESIAACLNLGAVAWSVVVLPVNASTNIAGSPSYTEYTVGPENCPAGFTWNWDACPNGPQTFQGNPPTYNEETQQWENGEDKPTYTLQIQALSDAP